jgi:hypothetical protein
VVTLVPEDGHQAARALQRALDRREPVEDPDLARLGDGPIPGASARVAAAEATAPAAPRPPAPRRDRRRVRPRRPERTRR